MIREASRKDVKSLYSLESSIFSKEDFALSLSSFYYHVKRNPLFVYEEDSIIKGYILWLKRKNCYRLYSICTGSDFQGKGIGKELLRFSFEKLKAPKYRLEVKTQNLKAVALYEKWDFKKKGVIKNFYPDNSDAYLMVKNNDLQL